MCSGSVCFGVHSVCRHACESTFTVVCGTLSEVLPFMCKSLRVISTYDVRGIKGTQGPTGASIQPNSYMTDCLPASRDGGWSCHDPGALVSEWLLPR